MKTTKMSLADMQGKLSRAEMKNIVAGSGDGCLDNYPNGQFCLYDWDCSFSCGGNIITGQCVASRCVHP